MHQVFGAPEALRVGRVQRSVVRAGVGAAGAARMHQCSVDSRARYSNRTWIARPAIRLRVVADNVW